jgi:hypothetical protein
MQSLRLLADLLKHSRFSDFLKHAPAKMKEGELFHSDTIVADLTNRLRIIDFNSEDDDEFADAVGFVHLALEVLGRFAFPYLQGREMVNNLNLKLKQISNSRRDISTATIEGDRAMMIQGLLGCVLKFFVVLAKRNQRMDDLEEFWENVVALLIICKDNLGFLESFGEFVQVLPAKATLKEFSRVFQILKGNVGSYSSKIRLQSCKILQIFELPDFVVQKDSTFQGKINVLMTYLGVPDFH